MRTASLALLLLAVPQDEEAIRGWIRDLEDDAPATRDRAAAALLQADAAAEPWLRRAAEGGGTELRGRAADLLRAMARRRLIEPLPSRISLRVDQAPFRDVLESLRRQSRTPVQSPELAEELAARPLTLDVRDAPLFAALDAVCRAHGGLTWDWTRDAEDGGGPAAVLEEGIPSAAPRAEDGPYAVRLDSIRTSLRLKPGAAAAAGTSLSFTWSCERGVRALGARVELAELRDDRGRSYAERIRPAEPLRADVEFFHFLRDVELAEIPPEPAARFSLIRGALVVVLPTAVEELEFVRPAGLAGAERRAGPHLVKLVEFDVEDGTAKARVEFRPASLEGRTRVVLRDAAGKPVEGRGVLVETADGEDWVRETYEFPLGEGREAALLHCTLDTGLRERRIPFEFRDVRFR